MSNPFIKFEKFGAVCDFETRKKIAQEIFTKLVNGKEEEEESFLLPDEETENFASAIEIILSNETLRQMTKLNPELAAETTQAILEFIHQTKRAINALGNPYQEEVNLLDGFAITVSADYKSYWKIIKDFLKSTYPKEVINTSFYTRAFNKTFKPKEEKNEMAEDEQSYESVRDHLADKWREEILLKIVEFQQEKIDEFLLEFTSNIFPYMEELKEFKEKMYNMTTDFNGIFDLPEGGLSKENFEVLKKYHELLEMNDAVQDLVSMLGRMQQLVSDEETESISETPDKFDWQVKHASKTDLIGVKESDDLNNLLPSETALLSDPTLQTLFFKKFAEKKLQTFEFEDDINDNKSDGLRGPFIICVDTSGSMRGMPETIAKTICLAILKIALKEKRNCYLITFSVGIVTLDLTDLKNNLDRIVEFLAMSFHGGTDASPAMAEATQMLEKEEFQKADVLMISDFEMPQIQPSIISRIKKAKENKTKFHSLVIGGYPNPHVVNGFDHNWYYNPYREDSIFELMKGLKKL